MRSRGLTIGLAVAGGIAVVGVVGLLAFSFAQARKLLRPYRKPHPFAPHELGLPFEDVEFAGPQGTLRGWYLPSQSGATLICCHGIHDNGVQWAAQVAALHARSGHGALLFDFCGHGRSDGGMVTYGVRERADILAAMRYLRERGDVDMTRIGLMGYSLGAIASVLVAAEQPEVRALVIESGFADLLRDMRSLFTRFTRLPAFPFANLVVFWAERLSGERLATIRPARVIGRISPRAVLIISDLRDTLADEPYDGEQLYRAAREPKQLWQVSDAEHVQAYNVRPEEWIERVGAFLDEYLSPVAQPDSAEDTRRAEVRQPVDECAVADVAPRVRE